MKTGLGDCTKGMSIGKEEKRRKDSEAVIREVGGNLLGGRVNAL